MDIKKIVPAAIVATIVLGFSAGVVGNWVLDIMDSSYRTEGRYSRLFQVPPPPAQLPKDSYVCPQGEKTPWFGCTVQ